MPAGCGRHAHPIRIHAAIRDRQALADELRARVYALSRLAPPALDKPRRAIGKLLRQKLPMPRTDRAA